MTEPMLSFEGVTYTYANQRRAAVRDINFRVRPGELKVVTGPSGCGKTTLIRLANGLCPQIYGGVLEGVVTASGRNVSITPVAELAETVGTLFQDPEEQFFSLNVGDEIAFALKSRGVSADEVERRTHDAACRLGIEGLLSQSIHALSEGQKQKVGLASLLALGPQVIIFDEPSANLDPESTQALAFTLAELKKDGAALLVVDHRLYWLRDVADSVCVMAAGQIVLEGAFSVLDDEVLCAGRGLRHSTVPDLRDTLPRVPVTFGEALTNEDAVFGASRMSFSWTDDQHLFTDASFAVPRGITALIGSNGTGKTTLARILTGLNKAQGVFTIGRQVVGAEGLMPHTGLVLQNADHQLQMRTVYEEVLSACVAAELADRKERVLKSFSDREAVAEREARAASIVDRLGLGHLASRHPQSLSGGEKQRLVIACAVAKKPSVLILDEPTSGLDGANMKIIADLLKEEARRGAAVFLITHDLELLAICDNALDMRMLRRR